MNTHISYTDGACTNNGSPFAQAGWGAVLANPQGDTLEIAGPVPEGQHQTNSRAELMAVAEALEQCKQPAPIILQRTTITSQRPCRDGWRAGRSRAGRSRTRSPRSISTYGAKLHPR